MATFTAIENNNIVVLRRPRGKDKPSYLRLTFQGMCLLAGLTGFFVCLRIAVNSAPVHNEPSSWTFLHLFEEFHELMTNPVYLVLTTLLGLLSVFQMCLHWNGIEVGMRDIFDALWRFDGNPPRRTRTARRLT